MPRPPLSFNITVFFNNFGSVFTLRCDVAGPGKAHSARDDKVPQPWKLFRVSERLPQTSSASCAHLASCTNDVTALLDNLFQKPTLERLLCIGGPICVPNSHIKIGPHLCAADAPRCTLWDVGVEELSRTTVGLCIFCAGICLVADTGIADLELLQFKQGLHSLNPALRDHHVGLADQLAVVVLERPMAASLQPSLSIFSWNLGHSSFIDEGPTAATISVNVGFNDAGPEGSKKWGVGACTCGTRSGQTWGNRFRACYAPGWSSSHSLCTRRSTRATNAGHALGHRLPRARPQATKHRKKAWTPTGPWRTPANIDDFRPSGAPLRASNAKHAPGAQGASA